MDQCIIPFGEFNWWAVLVAGIAGYAVGALWYQKFLFANAWMKLEGLKEEELQSGFIAPLLITLITTLLTAFVMQAIVLVFGANDLKFAFPITVLIGIILIAGNTLSDYLFARKPMKLFWIVAMQRVLMILVMTIILILM